MRLKAIEVKTVQGYGVQLDPVYILTITDSNNVESMDFLNPGSIERITLNPKSVCIIYTSGDKQLLKIPTWNKNLIDKLGAIADRSIGPGAGLKVNQYYTNIKNEPSEEENFKKPYKK